MKAELERLEGIPPTTLKLRAPPSAESVRGAPASELEATVLAFGRPTLLVQDHTFALPELHE